MSVSERLTLQLKLEPVLPIPDLPAEVSDGTELQAGLTKVLELIRSLPPQIRDTMLEA